MTPSRPTLVTLVKRLCGDLIGVYRHSDRETFFAYLRSVAAAFPDILRSGTLVSADRRMKGRNCRFAPLPGAWVTLDGQFFSAAREMYCRRVYFRRPGFEIRSGDVVVDLGANVGLFTTMAGIYGGRVVAVEAQSGFLPVIRANLDRNACRHQAAIEFALVGASTGVLRTKEARRTASHWSDEPPELSMADIFRRHHLKEVHLMKVDIEGSEFDLFSGDPGWLDVVNRIVMEVHPQFGEPNELRVALRRAGFVTHLTGADWSRAVDTIAGDSGYLFAAKAGL